MNILTHRPILFRPSLMKALPPYDFINRGFLVDKSLFESMHCFPAARIGQYIDEFKQAEDCIEARIDSFDIQVFSANACTLERKHVEETWLSQLADRKVAVAMIQESRDKKSGIRVTGSLIIITSAANEQGSYGCRIIINSEVPFARKLRGSKLYIKQQHITILESSPRLLIVSAHAAAINAVVISAHAPHSIDENGHIWWNFLSSKFRLHQKGRQIILGVDANIDLDVSLSPHVGDRITPKGKHPRYQSYFIDLLSEFGLFVPSKRSFLQFGYI